MGAFGYLIWFARINPLFYLKLPLSYGGEIGILMPKQSLGWELVATPPHGRFLIEPSFYLSIYNKLT